MDIVGASRFHAIGDLQHTGNLGTDQYFLASIMDDIIEHGPLRARSKEKKCEELWMLIQAEHDQQGTTNRIGNLTPSMIKNGEHFPCLATKAAETSHLIPVMAEVCRTLSNGSDADEHRQRAIDNLAKFYRILRRASMFLTDGEYNDAKSAIEWHLLHYNWLHHDAVNRGVRLYVIQYKHHNLWHIADHAKYLNPMFIWCYPFEDFVGVMILSARNCIAGSPMRIVGRKVIENWCLVSDLTMKHGLEAKMSV